jgi:4-amino-4-deoxy-L-arabinose transferase and related glycosyltransferases of PMT family
VNTQKLLQTLLSFLLPSLLFYALFRELTGDEIEGIHSGWKVLYNGIIYKDFFQHHHPFPYYFTALIIKLFGATTHVIYLLRFIYFLICLGTGYATYLLAKMFTDKSTAILSTLLLYSAPVFVTRAIEIRPDNPMVLCAMISITCWFYYLKTSKASYFITSAISLSCAFLILQKALFIMLPLGLLILTTLLLNTSLTKAILKTLTYGLLFLILPTLYLCYLIYTNSLSEYITLSWLLNLKITHGHPISLDLPFAIKSSLFLWIPFLIGSYYALYNKTLWPMLFLALTLNSVYFLVICHLIEYMLPALPFTAIIAAYGLSKMFNSYKALMLIIIVFPVGLAFVRGFRTPTLIPISAQLKKMDYVLAHTNQNDYVLDNCEINIFRNDPGFIWFGICNLIDAYNKITPYTYDVYQIIETKNQSLLTLPALPKYRHNSLILKKRMCLKIINQMSNIPTY